MACHFNFEKHKLLTLLSEPEGPSNTINKLLESQFTAKLFSQTHRSKIFPWASIFSFVNTTPKASRSGNDFQFFSCSFMEGFHLHSSRERGPIHSFRSTEKQLLLLQNIAFNQHVPQFPLQKKGGKACSHHASEIKSRKYYQYLQRVLNLSGEVLWKVNSQIKIRLFFSSF